MIIALEERPDGGADVVDGLVDAAIDDLFFEASEEAVASGIARGVALRHDHGSPFMADHFRNQNRNTAAANRQLACCDCFAVSKEPGPVHLQQVLADQRAKAAALVVEAVPAVDEAANL